MGDFDVDARAKTGSQIGWASQNVTQMLVPHIFVTRLLHQGLHLQLRSGTVINSNLS